MLILLTWSIISCKKQTTETQDRNSETLSIPKGFPDIPFPADNTFSQIRWELGKKLFNDPILSRDSSLSCGTCHKPELAFADNLDFSPGIENRPGVRNVPTLANVGYHPYFLKEGGVPTLEMQVLVPIQEHNEFDHNIVLLTQKLQTIPSYVEMSNKAYKRDPDPFVITRAIATYERSMISGNSRYDQYQKGNHSALSEEEIRGMQLFFSTRTNCSQCHEGFDFTNYEFKNNGLAKDYNDYGRMRLTNDSTDLAMFKTPTLRNIEYTSPYMHNAQFKTLEEVVEHYNSGGFNHGNKSELIQPLNLSSIEQANLVAFLKSLTDHSFLNDERWK